MQERAPKKRTVWDDANYFDESIFRSEATGYWMEFSERFDGDLSADSGGGQTYLHTYVVNCKNREFRPESKTVENKLCHLPLVGVGTFLRDDGTYEDKSFVVENLYRARLEVVSYYNPCFRCWDENGRMYMASYSREAWEAGDDTVRSFFEVRLLKSAGIELVHSLAPDDPLPANLLFTDRYSEIPRAASRVYGLPATQWEGMDTWEGFTEDEMRANGMLPAEQEKKARRFSLFGRRKKNAVPEQNVFYITRR